MPGFWKTLKKWLADSYDYLGLVLASSFVWFGVTFGGFAGIAQTRCADSAVLLSGAVAVLYIFLVAPLTAGIHLMAKKIVTRDDPSLLDLLAGFREYLTASWRLGFAQVLVTALIVVNAWFYLTRGHIAVQFLGIVFLYLLMLWGLSLVYHYPTLIEQKPGIFKVLKRGFLLAMDNVAFTGGVLFAIILLTCFCGLTLLGMPLLYMGMVSILQTRALRALFVKYELLPPEKEPSPEEEAVSERA